MRSVGLSNVLLTRVKRPVTFKAGLEPTNFAIEVAVKHIIDDTARGVYQCAQQCVEQDIYHHFFHGQSDMIGRRQEPPG
jgi:hypothetical protein